MLFMPETMPKTIKIDSGTFTVNDSEERLSLLLGHRVADMVKSGELTSITHIDSKGVRTTFGNLNILDNQTTEKPVLPSISLAPDAVDSSDNPKKPETHNKPTVRQPNKPLSQPQIVEPAAPTKSPVHQGTLSPQAIAIIEKIEETNSINPPQANPSESTLNSDDSSPSLSVNVVSPNLENNSSVQNRPTKTKIRQRNMLKDNQNDYQKRIKRTAAAIGLGLFVVGSLVALSLHGHDVHHGMATQGFLSIPDPTHPVVNKNLIHATSKGINTLHQPGEAVKSNSGKEHASSVKTVLRLGRTALLKLSSQNQPGIIKGLNVRSDYPWTVAMEVNKKDPMAVLNQAANIYNKLFKSHFSLKSDDGQYMFANGKEIINSKQQTVMNWIIEALNKSKA